MDHYLAIDVYYGGIITKRIKRIYIADFESKRLYCGLLVLGSSYDPLIYTSKNIKIVSNSYSYFIPIKDFNQLEMLMKIDTTDFLYHNIEKFFKKYDFLEWLI
jgi:hypothetical protein